MRCVLKLQTKASVSDVVHMLSVSTNDYVKTMNCMQRTSELKENVNMQHHMESQMHVDAICISMRSRHGIYVHSALFEASRTIISNILKSIMQAKWMLNVYIVMPFAGRVRLVPFVVVVAKCNSDSLGSPRPVAFR